MESNTTEVSRSHAGRAGLGGVCANTPACAWQRQAQLGESAKAVEHFESALHICEDHLGEGHLQTVRNLFALGHTYMNQSRWEDAYRVLRRQSEIVQREHLPDYEIPLNALGCLFTNMGMYKEAEQALLKKLEITRRERGQDAGFGWFTANLAKAIRRRWTALS